MFAKYACAPSQRRGCPGEEAALILFLLKAQLGQDPEIRPQGKTREISTLARRRLDLTHLRGVLTASKQSCSMFSANRNRSLLAKLPSHDLVSHKHASRNTPWSIRLKGGNASGNAFLPDRRGLVFLKRTHPRDDERYLRCSSCLHLYLLRDAKALAEDFCFPHDTHDHPFWALKRLRSANVCQYSA